MSEQAKSDKVAAVRKHPEKSTEDTIKETFESIIIAFVLAFTFRAYVVEAFVIPTGSMAPTLLGAHYTVQCEQCGYRFTVDTPYRGEAVPPLNRAGVGVLCPMCGYRTEFPVKTLPDPGDRILVQKYIYSVSEPRRWDVVVFKNPAWPQQNYIKRLVGLENEKLLIVGGNVFQAPLNEAGEPIDRESGEVVDRPQWRIARKTDRRNPHWEKIQRTVFQPLYFSDYVPLDGGEKVDPVTTAQKRVRAWELPWQAVTGDWDFRGARGYVYTPKDRHASTGRIEFDMSHTRSLAARYAYDQFRGAPDEPIDEIRLAADVRADGPGVSVSLETTARLTDLMQEAAPVRAHFASDGTVRLERQVTDENGAAIWQVLTDDDGQPRQVKLGALEAGETRAIELWHVDHELLVWADGACIMRHPIDLTLEFVKAHRAVSDRPAVAIEVVGAPATLFDVALERDLYYGPRDSGASRALHASGNEPLEIGPDRFFVLGDNGPVSQDGRYWGFDEQRGGDGKSGLNPWIRQRLFDGDADAEGFVPRELMMGRAFFVYFPAPHRFNFTGSGFFPDFASMRRIY